MKNKIVVNDLPGNIGAEFVKQEFSETTWLKFVRANGDAFHVQFTDDGIEVRVVREKGNDQMTILPKMPNCIEIY